MARLFQTFCLLVLLILPTYLSAYGKKDLSFRSDLRPIVRKAIAENYASLENLYKDLHSHPELSFHEVRTSKKLADELRSLGFQVSEQVGGYGVVGVFRNGSGPTIMIRTDMDALPVKEQTNLKFASNVLTIDDSGQEVGVMHACGHDMHMTVLIGTAKVLSKLEDQWQGTLMLVAQPAEERGAGAKKMIEDGLYKRFPKPDYAFALHVDAGLPAGSVGVTEGPAMANVDAVDIKVRGVSGHGAYPHTTKDPIVLASQIVLALQTIISREVPVGEPAVISIGSIQGGTKRNIIPGEVNLYLTVRSYTDMVRNKLLESIKRVSEGQAISAGLDRDHLPLIKVEEEFTPAVYNEPKLASFASEVFKVWFGLSNFVKQKPSLAGEDFSRYGRTDEKVPICLFWLGAVEKNKYYESKIIGKQLPSLHSDTFVPDVEPTMKTGVEAMSSLVLNLGSKKT